MRTLSIDYNEAAVRNDHIRSADELSWLGELSPELTAKKSARFIAQTLVGIAIVAALVIFI